MGNEHFINGMWEYVTLKKWSRRSGFGMMPRGRSKKEYWVSGSNLLSRRSWSRLEEMKIWDAAQKSCGKAFSQKVTADGKISMKNAE